MIERSEIFLAGREAAKLNKSTDLRGMETRFPPKELSEEQKRLWCKGYDYQMGCS